MRKHSLSLIAIVLITSQIITACATPTAAPAAQPAAAAPKVFVKAADLQPPPATKLFVLPADVVSDKQLRIAMVMVQNNPFGAAMKLGTDYAKKVLADRNAVVDWIAIGDFDPKKFEDAIQNAITAKYDAITMFGLSEALQPVVDRAVDAGILVYITNTEPGPTSKRQAYFGQDGFKGGQTIGAALEKALGGEGEYAIITGSFNVYGPELRRKGARDILDKATNMKLVGEFENQDKSEEAYNITQNLLTSNPNLKGIYITAGGPFGAAKAIKDAGLKGKITIVCHDWMGETVTYIREGYISAVLDQDPFNQGYAPVVAAFNKLAANQTPPELNWFEGDIATPDNVSEKIPLP